MTGKSGSKVQGWYMSGAAPSEYEHGIDKENFHSGTQCAYMKNDVEKPSNFATLMQNFNADNYLGKRIQLTFWLKTKKISWASGWMRIDGRKRSDMLAFDNMCERTIKGTTDWTQYSIVLDVPEKSTGIFFGVMMSGKGKLWFDDVELKTVSKKVPVTDCRCMRSRGKEEPSNLNFEE